MKILKCHTKKRGDVMNVLTSIVKKSGVYENTDIQNKEFTDFMDTSISL